MWLVALIGEQISYIATHYYSLQHTAPHCNTCNTLQHTVTHCNALQRTATHCNALPATIMWLVSLMGEQISHIATHHNSLQLTAPHCNALQHTATHCNTLQRTAVDDHVASCADGGGVWWRPQCATSRSWVRDIATHCNTLQHAATHCNTLQHTATHCNTPGFGGDSNVLLHVCGS